MAITKYAEGMVFGSTRFMVQSVNHRSLIPSSYSLRQGLSADVAARPSAHPLVPISINLTQNAITVQSAPVAASWCRAVCAVMSLHSLSVSLSIYLSPCLSLLQINFSTFPIFLLSFAGPYPLSPRRPARLVQTMDAVNELTENLTSAPTSHSYTPARNNERVNGGKEREGKFRETLSGRKHIGLLRGSSG